MSIKAMTWYWDNSKQDGHKLLLLLALSDWSDDEGQCYPSTKRLAQRIRRDRRSVQRSINELEKAGELLIHQGMGKGPDGQRSSLFSLLKYRDALAMETPPMLIEAANHYREQSRRQGRKGAEVRKAQAKLLETEQGVTPTPPPTGGTDVTPTGGMDVTPTGGMDVTPTGGMDVTQIRQSDPSVDPSVGATTTTPNSAEPGSRRRQPPPLSSVAPTQTAQPTTMRNGTEPTERTRQNDPAYDAICTAIESNGFGYMTPVLAKQVKDAMEIHPQTAIEKAIEIAVGQNKRFWNYVTGILDNMQREGYNYDNGQFRRERSGHHRGHAAPESAADQRQREYNERYTCLVADEINRVITHEQAAAGWAALEAEFAGYEYRDMPQVR